MNSYGKTLAAPVVHVGRLQAELVIVKNLAVCGANPQIFFYAAGTTQKQSSVVPHSAVSVFQIGSDFNN